MILLVKGLLTALCMTLGIGPGVLLNFQTSIRRGFAAGLAVVAGLYLSDCLIIGIDYFGLSHLSTIFQHRRICGIVCGTILSAMGISLWLLRPKSITSGQLDLRELPCVRSLLKAFAAGFAVNITNPFVYVFWVTLMGIAACNFGSRTHAFFGYFFVVIVSALALDITKSYLFSRFSVTIKEPLMAWINRGMGTALAMAGIIIVCKTNLLPVHP